MKFKPILILFGFLSLMSLSLSEAAPRATAPSKAPSPWVRLEPGLEVANLLAPKKSPVGDSLIHILRIDPAYFNFRLLNTSAQPNAGRLSAKNWAKRHGLVATINASMYQADKTTSVSLMQTQGHINNTWYSKDRALLVFDATDPALPTVQILDRDCQKVKQLRPKYRTLIQSIRMISCDGKNVWEQRKKIWSTSAIGMDRKGNILFIHTRSPYSTHDLINNLLALPIDIKRAMYVEGGAEAQLYIHSGDSELELVGSYSSGSNENDANTIGWPIPNVVGISRKVPLQK